MTKLRYEDKLESGSDRVSSQDLSYCYVELFPISNLTVTKLLYWNRNDGPKTLTGSQGLSDKSKGKRYWMSANPFQHPVIDLLYNIRFQLGYYLLSCDIPGIVLDAPT